MNKETQELFPDWRIVADFKVAPDGDVCLTRVCAQERRVSRYGGGSRERIIEWNGEEISGTENGKPWEDIQVLSAPVLGARLTQDYLFKGLKDLFDQIKKCNYSADFFGSLQSQHRSISYSSTRSFLSPPSRG